MNAPRHTAQCRSHAVLCGILLALGCFFAPAQPALAQVDSTALENEDDASTAAPDLDAGAAAAEPAQPPPDVLDVSAGDAASPSADSADAGADDDDESAAEEPPPITRDLVEGNLQGVLNKHAFCAEDDYQIRLDEQTLCQLSDAVKRRCPNIEKTCKNPFANEKDDWHFSWDWLNLPDLSWLLRGLAWLVVIFVVVMIITTIIRRVITTRGSEGDDEDEAPPLEEEEAPTSLNTETDVERLLASARRAADAGDFAAAIKHAYAALLRKLDQEGLIEVHRSRTNGDYRRSLAERPALQAEFGSIVRHVERVQFGSDQASPQTFRAIFERVLPLVQRGAGLILCVLAALGTSACEQLEQRPRASALGCGETPGGYSVMCEMLKSHGSNVKRRIRKVDAIDEKVARIIVLGEANLSEEEWTKLDEWVRQGHTLILAKVPSPLSVTLNVERSDRPCSNDAALVDSIRPYYGVEVELRSLRSHALSLNPATSWVLTRCDVGPTLAGTTHGEGTVLLLPDSSFLTNMSLAAADNAYLAVNLFSRHGEDVEVIGEWTGSGSTNPFEALRSANLTPWLLQLVLVAVLLALWRGAHFGLPRDPVSLRRHAFVEHLEALGLKYARSKASRHALANYGGWALARLHDRLRPGARAQMSDLSAALAKLTGRSETAVLQILIAAKSAQDEAHDTATVEEHLNTMRELESLLRAAGGTR